jgi:hypothetical protein
LGKEERRTKKRGYAAGGWDGHLIERKRSNGKEKGVSSPW